MSQNSFYDDLNIPILVISDKKSIIFANEAFSNSLGYDLIALEKKDISFLLKDHSDEHKIDQILNNNVSKHVLQIVDTHLCLKTFLISVLNKKTLGEISLIFQEIDNSIYSLIFAKLQTNNNFYRYSDDIIFELDSSATKIINLNSLCETKIGFNIENILNYDLRLYIDAMISDTDKEAFNQILYKIQSIPIQSESFPIEFYYYGKVINYKQNYYKHSIFLNNNNSNISFINVVKDITELKDLQIRYQEVMEKQLDNINLIKKFTDDNLFYSNELEKVNSELLTTKEKTSEIIKIKDEFISNISHQIRTPMNSIIGFSQMILTDNNHPISVINDTKKIYKGAKTILDIIDNCLDASLFNFYKTSIEKRKFPLKNLLFEVLGLVQSKATEKNLIIDLSIEKNIPNIIYSDPLRLRDILLGLIDNAIKFTDYGEITIKVQVQRHSLSDLLLFTIIDTGIGISEKIHDTIFTQYFKYDRTNKKSDEPLNVPLVQVKNLVNSLNGEIWFDSILQKGSTFCFTVPLEDSFPDTSDVQNKEISIPNLSPEDFNFKNKKLLIVDDDYATQEIFQRLSKRCNYDIQIANNGHEALKILQACSPDLILMDIQMPLMDGCETTYKIRQIDRFVNVPIIALTAHALAGDKEKFLSAGMSEYISKPFQIDHVLTVFSKYIGDR